jgi:DNA-binding CsgD family transcriptional regulator
MKVLVNHREEETRNLEDRVVMNIKNLIIPFMEKMKSSRLNDQQLAYLQMIETHTNDITSLMAKRMHQFNFTRTEVEVASLIKEGKLTRDIAKIIGIATSSVNTHRNNIRKKLGISKEKVNLQSHLQSLD